MLECHRQQCCWVDTTLIRNCSTNFPSHFFSKIPVHKEYKDYKEYIWSVSLDICNSWQYHLMSEMIGEHYKRTMCFGWRFMMYDDGDLFLFSTFPLTEEVWPVSFSHLRGHPSSYNTIVTLVTRRQSLKTEPVSCLQYILYILLTIVLLLFNFRSLCLFFADRQTSMLVISPIAGQGVIRFV